MISSVRLPSLFAAAIATLALGVGIAGAAAVDDGGFATLDAACKDLAGEIDKAVTAEKLERSIVIQSFTNGTAFPNAQIGRLLTTSFEEKKYKVQDKGGAPVFVKGTLHVNKTSLVIETDLHRSGEGRLQSWKHRVNSLETAAQGSTFDITTASADRTKKPAETAISNATSSSAPVTAKEQAADAIRQDTAKPQTAITNDGTVARPAPGSKFGVSIVTNKGGKPTPLPITTVDGLAIVQLAMDQEFTLSIVNDSTNDVGASVSIDGVNMFVFSEVPSYKELGKLWVGPAGGRIDGWYHNDRRSRSFQMGRYDESVAASVGVTEGVGGITVTFYGDPTGRQSRPRTAVRPETGIKAGAFVDSNYSTKSGEFGELIAAVTVRYQKSDHPTDLPPGAK